MCALIKNPLQRDGTSQQERLAKILMPENAKIDDRSIEEIITFATEYIKLVNYYDTNNEIDKDSGWSCFYENDPCILLAILTSTDTDSIEARFKDLEEKVLQNIAERDKGNYNETEAGKLTGYYDDLINLIFKVAQRIQDSCIKLPPGQQLKADIITIIKNDLHLAIIDNNQQDALIKLIGYDKASIEPVNDYTSFIQSGKNNSCECTIAWQLDKEGYDCIYPDTSFDMVSLKALFYIFFIALLHIKQKAKIYFEACIKETDSHQPHITLFLTFLYLFRNAVDHLNTLTRSHLLYYYETILCLHKKAAIPDKVHIIFELAKNFDTHLVEQGTLLNAGKDDTSKQMVYGLLEEVVVNKAKVEEIKTVYIDEAAGVVHAASMADSKDGKGDSFSKDEQAHWKPLGGPDSPANEVGFALASPMFFLKEGFRAAMITYQFEKNDGTKTPPPANSFRFLYSSGKEWVEVENIFDAIKRIITTSKYPNLYNISGKWITDSWIKKAINLFFNFLKDLYANQYDLKETSVLSDSTSTDPSDINSLRQNIEPIFKNIISNNFDEIAKTLVSIGASKNLTGLDETALLNELLSVRNDILSLKNIYVNRIGNVKIGESGVSRFDLDFLIVANTTSPAFTPLVVDEKKPDIRSEWPLVKILIKNIADTNGILSSQYTASKDLKITGVDIKVAAYGLKELVVQNDLAILDNSKEIQPFTNHPYPGSNFYFGNKETFQKKLDILGLQFEWAGRPPDFKTYYKNYVTDGVNGPSNTVDVVSGDDFFTADFELLNNGVFQNIFGGSEKRLFDKNGASKRILAYGEFKNNQKIALKSGNDSSGTFDGTPVSNQTGGKNLQNFPLRNFARNPYMNDFTEYNVNTQRGFARLSLNHDFFHDDYPKSLLFLTVGATQPLTKLVNEPYTPKLKNTSLFYVSTERINFGAGEYNATIEQFFHIHPFGYLRQPIEEINTVPLLPQFLKAQDATDIERKNKQILLSTPTESKIDLSFSEGNMYIGLKNAKPEQKVNILFQVLDGSGNNKYAPPDIEWDYLVNNDWFPFKPFEIQDHTRADESSKKSLLKSGIIEFSLPKIISSKETTILDSSLLWIRACAHEDALPADPNLTQGTERIAALPDLVAIIAQAGIAQFEDHGNSPNHLALPLPAGKISKFIDSRAAIKTVSQPFNSFDGRLAENDNQFYRRISERLRHKNRAICIWDYERLVLEQFPDLYKVKCLNHTDILENKEIAPGFVTITVIPDLRNRNAANKIEPRVPIGMLDEIKAYLKKRTNLFVASPFTDKLDYLQVVNPLYEQVKVTCCVRFYEGFDPAYYKYVLNQDLKNFLAPWAYNANSEICFGSAYHKSAILNFIEERKYVDVVLGFKVEHFNDDLTTPLPDHDADWIIPTTSRSILTSYNIIGTGEEYEHKIEFIPYVENNPCPACTIAK